MHALAVIANQGAQQINKPDALKAGHENFAESILNTFATDVGQSSKFDLICSIVDSGLTCEEFDAQLKQAQKLASNIDEVNGFIPDTSKGAPVTKRYGPRRNILNTQASMMRQVFGAMKQTNGQLVFVGVSTFSVALHTARTWLEDNGKTWDGNNVPDKVTREVKAKNRQMAQAHEEVKKANPQWAGETWAQYQARTLELVDDYVIKAKDAQAWKFLVELYGSEDGVMEFLERTVAIEE